MMKMETNYKKIVGQRITLLRKALEMTQEALAEKADMSVGGISDLETGKNFPRAETAVKIANALGVQPYEIFMDPNTSPNEKIYQKLTALLEKIQHKTAHLAIIYNFVQTIISFDINKK